MAEWKTYQNQYLGSVENIAEVVKEHWRRYWPSLYRDAKKHGTLDELALSTADQTIQWAASMESAGYDPIQAASIAMREVALSPPC